MCQSNDEVGKPWSSVHQSPVPPIRTKIWRSWPARRTGWREPPAIHRSWVLIAETVAATEQQYEGVESEARGGPQESRSLAAPSGESSRAIRAKFGWVSEMLMMMAPSE